MPVDPRILCLGLIVLITFVLDEATRRGCDASPIDDATQSVVRVRTSERAGAGFLAKHGGIAVTSLSLVRGAQSIAVECSDGEVLSVVGAVGLDLKNDLVALRLGELSNCPPLRVAEDDDARGPRVVALAPPDALGDMPHRSQIGDVFQKRSSEGGAPGQEKRDPPSANGSLLQLIDPPPRRFIGGPMVDEDGMVRAMVSGVEWRADPAVAAFAVSSRELRALITDLFPRPVALSELAELSGTVDPSATDESDPASSVLLTEEYWDRMSRILGEHVVRHHEWCVKNGYREPVLTPADRRNAHAGRLASEQGDARERVRLRGLGFDPLAILAAEAMAKKTAESRQVIRSLVAIGELQKSTSKALHALDARGVNPQIVRFVDQLRRAYDDAGERSLSSVDPQRSDESDGASESDGNAKSLTRALERIAELQNTEGPLLREKVSAEVSVVLGPVVYLSPEDLKLVSGEAAVEARQLAYAEAQAAKLWAQYERARENGGGEKTLRHIIEKFPGSESADRAQRLLDRKGAK